MRVNFESRPVPDSILVGRGLNGTARRPRSPHAVPKGAAVALQDSAQSGSSVSPMRLSKASRSFGNVECREKGRGERRCRPCVEGMDARLLMAAGTPPTAAHIAALIGPTVKQYMAQDQIPGMAVAVTYKGRVVLTKGYGMADLSTGAPVTPQTQFAVGSVTKSFTGEAVLLLAQKPSLIKEPGIKSLNLDAPIGNYLRDRGRFHLPANWANLTSRELLNMSSGTPIPSSDPLISWYEVINASASNDLVFPPGTQFLYSNTNTWLAGELVSQLSGQTYEQFVTRNILRPLGMTHTTFLTADSFLPGQATGYELTQRGQLVQAQSYPASQWTYSSGNMVSSAADTAKYLSGLQQGKILSPSMYKTMWTPTYLPRPGYNPAFATPGLGWDDAHSITARPNGVEIYKAGNIPGYSSEVALFWDRNPRHPDRLVQGYGISVYVNSFSTETFTPLTEPIVDAIEVALDPPGIVDPQDWAAG